MNSLDNIWHTIELYIGNKLKGNELSQFQELLNSNPEIPRMVEFARHENINKNLNKYLEGSLSSNKVKELNEHISKDERLKADVNFTTAIHIVSQNQKLLKAMNLLDELDQNPDSFFEEDDTLDSEIPTQYDFQPEPIPTSKIKNTNKILGFAAILLLIVAAFFLLDDEEPIESPNPLELSKENIALNHSVSDISVKLKLEDIPDPDFNCFIPNEEAAQKKITDFFRQEIRTTIEYEEIKKELTRILNEEESSNNPSFGLLNTLSFHIAICNLRLRNMEAEETLMTRPYKVPENQKDKELEAKSKFYLAVLYYFVAKDNEPFDKENALKLFRQINSNQESPLSFKYKNLATKIIKWEENLSSQDL